jgi:hypothetical protein
MINEKRLLFQVASLLTYPIPCIPFLFKGEGEDRERGAAAPLRRPRYGIRFQREAVENFKTSAAISHQAIQFIVQCHSRYS